MVRFGDKLSASPLDIARVCANKLHREAYKHLVPLLRSKRRADEAAAVESALAALPRFDYSLQGPGYPSVEASARRSAQIVLISAALAATLGIATVLWLISVVALKWKADTGVSRLLNRPASSLCFAPPALLLASIALFLGYYPYARSIGNMHSYKELEYGYAPILMGLYNFTRFSPILDFWIARMFWPAVYCAALALVGAGLLWWVRHRPRPDRPDAA